MPNISVYVEKFLEQYSKEYSFTASDVQRFIAESENIDFSNVQISNSFAGFIKHGRIFRQSNGVFYLNPDYKKPTTPKYKYGRIGILENIKKFLEQQSNYTAFESDDVLHWFQKQEIWNFNKKQISSSLMYMHNHGLLTRINKGVYRKPYGNDKLSQKENISSMLKEMTLEERREILIEEFLDLTDQVIKALSYTSLLEDSLKYHVEEVKKLGFRPGAIRMKG